MNFKYNEVKGLVNNVNKNKISEILTRKHLNALNEIKKAEIKIKRLISKQKELLHLFNNLLDAILTENKNTTIYNKYNKQRRKSNNC